MGDYCTPAMIPQSSSLAHDICPVPGYAHNPLVNNLLFSLNSSLHLADHYRDVQNSLSPSELAAFTRRLRTTFGREGKVSMGGVGVVALTLALLFDTLAKEAKGQWAPESGPIPGLFSQEPGCPDLPLVPVASEYLRLVPHIANNPARMREETEKYLWKLLEMSYAYRQDHKLERLTGVCYFNIVLVNRIFIGLQLHQMRILSNATVLAATPGFLSDDELIKTSNQDNKLFMSPFNCDLEAANRVLNREILKRNDTGFKLEELITCGFPIDGGTSIEEGLTPFIELIFHVMLLDNPIPLIPKSLEEVIRHRDDFDLKAKSHLPF